MASNLTPTSDEARELSLIGKVEMRIALADTDAKLENLLKIYLAPLLLKLGSQSVSVRTKVISVCQHINTRLKSQDIQLPVASLLKQFKDYRDVQLIRHFDLLYIQQGISRIPVSERLGLLPELIRGIAADASKSSTHGSQLFNLILQLLVHFRMPPRGSKEDLELRERLQITSEDAQFLAFWFGKLILVTGVRTSQTPATEPSLPGVSAEEYKFLTQYGKADTWNPAADGGLNLIETKVLVGRFLASGAFNDKERFLPALYASADSNSRISDIGVDILKRTLPVTDLDDKEIVEQLYEIFFGSGTSDGPQPARVPLRIRVLGLLSKSITSTAYAIRIHDMVKEAIDPDAMSGLEALKLRAAVFSYVNFAAKNGATSDLAKIAPALIRILRDFLEGQGWPIPAEGVDISQRGYAYELIGILAKAAPEQTLVQNNLDLLSWLFRSLRDDSSGRDVGVSIEESLSTTLSALSRLFQENKASFVNPASELYQFDHSLSQILLENVLAGHPIVRDQRGLSSLSKYSRSSRYVATRYANRCLPYGNLNARMIDILAIGGPDSDNQEVADEGRKGLDPYWYRMLNSHAVCSLSTSEEDWFRFPQFTPLGLRLFEHINMAKDRAGESGYLGSDNKLRRDLPIFSGVLGSLLSHSVRYLRQVLYHDALKEAHMDLEVSSEWARKLDTLVATDNHARSIIRVHCARTISNGHTRVIFSLMLRSAFEQLLHENTKDVAEAGETLVELCSFLPEEAWSQARLTEDFRLLERSVCSNNDLRRLAAAHAYGLIGSCPLCTSADVLASTRTLFDRASQWRGAVGASINQSSGAMLALAYLSSRISWRGRDLGDFATRHLKLVLEVLQHGNDTTLKEAAYLSLGQLSLFFIIKPQDLIPILPYKTAADKLYEFASTGNANAILALGQFGMISEEDEDSPEGVSRLDHVVNKIFQLHEVRQTEVQFTVGEALSFVACGWDSEALGATLDIARSSESGCGFSPPTGPGRRKTFPAILQRVLQSCRGSKPALKKASVIWLLCLLQYCGHKSEIQPILPACQTAFKMCLSDRDEVVQEAASRGLGLVYEKGDRSLKDELVKDLVGTFADNKPSLSGNVTAETQLFEPGVLPTGEGKSITTYKDILNLASEVGDSSLVYRFMSLAANNSIWSSRAAFGRFGLSSVLSDSSVDGYLAGNPKLYPKLFRYRFDPNPNVQRSMNDIWNALVKDSSATIDKYFDGIMQDLLQNILGKEWRVRQASCAAIADLVQGRELKKYEIYLGDIWTSCFKVLDDIKESVRAAAATLARVLAGILTRSLEAGNASSKNASTMLKNVLPFLLSTSGLESSAEEVQNFALSTLLQIIKKSPGIVLRPFIPELVERLLGMLSTLEPQAVNYLHLNASKYKLTEQKIDDMRLASVRGSPLMEAIERCLDLLDAPTMSALAFRLESAMKTAVGLPSKVGCSRVLVTLATRHSFLFKPHADHFLKLLEKHMHDRNETVTTSYGAAAGYLARIASDKQILALVSFCKKLYFDSEDDRSRISAGDVVHSLSKHSSDRFSSLASDLLPFVFVAKEDTIPAVKSLFKETWEDNVGGSRAVLLYFKEIMGLANEYLDSPKWVLKHTSSRAIAQAVMAATEPSEGLSKEHAEIIWPVLEKAIGGKTWDGKEEVLDAFVRFVARGKVLWESDAKVGEAIKKIAIREAKRNNAAYRVHSLPALGKICKARTDLEISETVAEVVEGVVDEIVGSNDDGQKMDVDGDSGKDSKRNYATLTGAIVALIESLNPALLPGSSILPPLTQALELVVRINPPKSPTPSLSLASFTELAAFFPCLASRRMKDEDNPEIGPLPTETKDLLDKVLLNPQHMNLPEAMRLERAKAVAALAGVEPSWKQWAGEMIVEREVLADEKALGVREILEGVRR